MDSPLLHQLDDLRRAAGRALDRAGLGPVTTPSRVVAATDLAEIRRYGGGTGPPLLVVPAPIKRGYIWDLAPAYSAVRRCLAAGLDVHLVDWRRPRPDQADRGLAAYLRDLAAALDAAAGPGGRSFVAGHSLGGTFAAILAAWRPGRVRGLVLAEAPVRFGAHAGAFAPAVRTPPDARSPVRDGMVPGSFLNLASAAAAPEAFVRDRWRDWLASLPDPEDRLRHLRVLRWTLDEAPLPARLFENVVDGLYRRDLFLRGELRLGGEAVSPQVAAPTLSVVDPASTVVPPQSVLPFHEAVRDRRKLLLRYGGDRGVALQHIGVLVGPRAHAVLWPRILDWLRGLPA